MPHMESLAVGIWISIGSRNEDSSQGGISHFLEHMLFKGTANLSSRKLKEEIEGRGGSLNGFTGEEVTCFLVKVSGQHLNIALDILSEMVLNASLKKEDIERERTVIIEEIKMYKDMPSHHVHDILSELMWKNHPLGLPIAGSIETVSAISRENLLRYKKANYIPKKIAIVLCGNLKHCPEIEEIGRIFKANVKEADSPINKFNNTQKEPRLKIFYKDTEQTHLAMGLHSFGREHKDRYVLGFIHIILGANMSSRLFENVREEKGLAYEIGTEIKRYNDAGAFIVHAGIEHKKVKDAIALIIKELRKIKKEAVSKNELERAKEFFKVQLLMALEDTIEHMLWLGDRLSAVNKLPNKEEIIKKVESVTISDIKRVSKEIFDKKNLNVALIGAIKDKEAKDIEKELVL